ncbi:hypothetical protein [Stenotrophomonas sp.]|uniref:hypothetical protein n=1 Tax=Stenotrophomonas sp. TaxID=69392 RepID=UPI0028A6415E|nr:hypothetical protein [Stenotrophomonas sp.]
MGKRLLLAALGVAGASAGCSMLGAQVPKCSDTETLDLVRQIIAEDVGAVGTNKLSNETLRLWLNIELPHATSLEENIKKYTCEATMVIKAGSGKGHRTQISYTSQLDDSDKHLVHAITFVGQDRAMLIQALEAALTANSTDAAVPQKVAVSDVVDPAMAAANVADLAVAADAGQVAALNESAENTPEQVAANEAIRDRIFSGNGEGGTPKFTDYPVAEVYSGPAAKLDTSSEEARTFRTRLSTALAEDPVDFAGEYVSAGWGCGTSCGYTTFVNKRTGQVIKSGLGGELGPRVRKHLPSSELLIAEGGEFDDDFNSSGNYAFFFRLQNDELQLIAKVPVPEEIY